MTCEMCVNYGFYKMITSNKPYGYSGDIPCTTCSRYSCLQDKFVLAEDMKVREKYHPVLPQKILKMDWKDGEPMDWIATKMFCFALKKKQDEIIDVINDMKKGGQNE